MFFLLKPADMVAVEQVFWTMSGFVQAAELTRQVVSAT